MADREGGGLGVILQVGLPGLLPVHARAVAGERVRPADRPASKRRPLVGEIPVGADLWVAGGVHHHADPLGDQAVEIVDAGSQVVVRPGGGSAAGERAVVAGGLGLQMLVERRQLGGVGRVGGWVDVGVVAVRHRALLFGEKGERGPFKIGRQVPSLPFVGGGDHRFGEINVIPHGYARFADPRDASRRGAVRHVVPGGPGLVDGGRLGVGVLVHQESAERDSRQSRVHAGEAGDHDRVVFEVFQVSAGHLTPPYPLRAAGSGRPARDRF